MPFITSRNTVAAVGLSVATLTLGLSACGGGNASTSSDPLAAHYYGSPSVNDYAGMDVRRMIPTYIEQLRSESDGPLEYLVGETTFFCAVAQRPASEQEIVMQDAEASQLGEEKGKVKQRLNFDNLDVDRVGDNALAGTPAEGSRDACNALPHLAATVPQQAVR